MKSGEGFRLSFCVVRAGEGKAGMDQPVKRFLISFGCGTFGDSGVLEFTAVFSKLRGKGKPAAAAGRG